MLRQCFTNIRNTGSKHWNAAIRLHAQQFIEHDGLAFGFKLLCALLRSLELGVLRRSIKGPLQNFSERRASFLGAPS
jgi:hypothetical protein